MRSFTQDEIQQIVESINKYHAIFIATNVGKDVLSQEDIEILESQGFNLDDFKNETYMNYAFDFGRLATALREQKANKLLQNMTFKDFKKYVNDTGGLPYSEKDTQTLNSVKFQAYNDIKGLGNRITTNVQNLLLQADSKAYTQIEADFAQRANYEKVIQDAALKTVARKQTAKFMVSELGHATGDWTRDFGRISDYVLHTAYQAGRANEYEKIFGDKESVKYYKQVYAGACKHCIRLYLTGGIGSQPILFELGELKANGTNIGKKVTNWKAVIGATHPFCRCELLSVDTSLYQFENGEWVAKESENSDFSDLDGLIEINIGDDNFYV